MSNLCDPDPPTSQMDRQTDGQTTCNLKTALCTIVDHAVRNQCSCHRASCRQRPMHRVVVVTGWSFGWSVHSAVFIWHLQS